MMEYNLEVNFIHWYKGWRMKVATVKGPHRVSDDSLKPRGHLYDPYPTAHQLGDSRSLPCVQLFVTTGAKIIEWYWASRSQCVILWIYDDKVLTWSSPSSLPSVPRRIKLQVKWKCTQVPFTAVSYAVVEIIPGCLSPSAAGQLLLWPLNVCPTERFLMESRLAPSM